jgi:thiol-disulfide isomerase/thioredoxin
MVPAGPAHACVTYASRAFAENLCCGRFSKLELCTQREHDLTRLRLNLVSLLQWCGPCRKFTPLLSVAYEDQPDPKEVQVGV